MYNKAVGLLSLNEGQLKPNSDGSIRQWDRIQESSMARTIPDPVFDYVKPERNWNFKDLALAYQLSGSETAQTDAEWGAPIVDFGNNAYTQEEEMQKLKEMAMSEDILIRNQGFKAFQTLYEKGLINEDTFRQQKPGLPFHKKNLTDQFPLIAMENLYKSGNWNRTSLKNDKTLGQLYRDMASDEINIHNDIADRYIVAHEKKSGKIARGMLGLEYGPHDIHLTRVGDDMFIDQANSNFLVEVDADMSNEKVAELIKESGFSQEWSERYDNQQISLQDALEHKKTYTDNAGYGDIMQNRGMHQKVADSLTQGIDALINSGVVTLESEPNKKYVILNRDFKVDDDLFAFNQWIGPDADKRYGIGGGSAALLLEVATPIGAFWGITKAGFKGMSALGTKGIIKQVNKTHMTDGFIKKNFDCSSPCNMKPETKKQYTEEGKSKGATDKQITAGIKQLEKKATLKNIVDDAKEGKQINAADIKKYMAETGVDQKTAINDLVGEATSLTKGSPASGATNQQKIIELSSAGKTFSQIQKETGLSGSYVSLVLKKAGLTGYGKNTSQLAAEMVDLSKSYSENLAIINKSLAGQTVKGSSVPIQADSTRLRQSIQDVFKENNQLSVKEYEQGLISLINNKGKVDLPENWFAGFQKTDFDSFGGWNNVTREIDNLKTARQNLLDSGKYSIEDLNNARDGYRIYSYSPEDYASYRVKQAGYRSKNYQGSKHEARVLGLKEYEMKLSDREQSIFDQVNYIYKTDTSVALKNNTDLQKAILNNDQILNDLSYRVSASSGTVLKADDLSIVKNRLKNNEFNKDKYTQTFYETDHIMSVENANKRRVNGLSNVQTLPKTINNDFKKPADQFIAKLLKQDTVSPEDVAKVQEIVKTAEYLGVTMYIDDVNNVFGYGKKYVGAPFRELGEEGIPSYVNQTENIINRYSPGVDLRDLNLNVGHNRPLKKQGGFINKRSDPKRGLVTTSGGYAGEGEEEYGYDEVDPSTMPGNIEWSVKKSLEKVQKDIREIYEDDVSDILYGISRSKKRWEMNKRDLEDVVSKRLNPPKPVKWKWSESPQLLTQSPIIRTAGAGALVPEKPLLDIVELFYNGINNVWGGKNVDMEKEFPGIYALHNFYKGPGVGETPKEQEYISAIAEINRAQETGLTRLAFNVADLILSIPDAALPTGFTEELKREYEKMDLAEPETFIGKIGAIAIEWGVPGGIAFKIINRARTFLKASSGGKVNMFTQKTYGMSGLKKHATQFSNVSKRVGSTALAFGAADFVAGGPYNTLASTFDDPLLTSKIVGKYEDTDDLYGDERVLANFRNRLRFGAEGMMIGALFPLAGPPLGYLAKNVALKPALAVGSFGLKTANTLAIKPATWLLSKDPVVFPGIAAGTGAFAKFLGKDVLARLGATAVTGGKAFMPSFRGPAGQLPDFNQWRMFDVMSKDPLKRGLKRVDNFLQWFRDSGNQAVNHFYLSGSAERFIKSKAREIEKYLDAIERKSYDLANGFLKRYNKGTTSPAGERHLLEQVYEYMKGNIRLNKLEPEIRELAKGLKNEFDTVRKRFFSELPEGGGLRQALETNLDKYMRMSFATFTNPGYAPSSSVREQAVDFMVDIIRKNENLLEAAVKGRSKEAAAAGPQAVIRAFAEKNVDSILAMGKTEGRDPIEILQRISKKILLNDDVMIKTGEELPLVIRKLLGQEKNLRYSVMSTANSVVTQTTNLRAWREAAKRGLEEGYLFESRELALAAGIVDPHQIGRVPGLALLETEAVAAKGGPVGLFASPEVAKTFAGTGGMLDSLLQNGFYQGLIAYKAGVQTGKTVFSPATQTRNFFSAGYFPMHAGHIGGNASVKDAFKIVVDDIFGAGRTVNEADVIKNITKKIELGVLDENIVASELSAILKDIKSGKLATLGKIAQKVDNAKLYQTATRVYAGGDNVWKWYGHEWYKSQLKGAFKNMDEVVDYMKNFHGIDINRNSLFTNTAKTLEDGIEEVAAHLLRETYPTYSKVPEFIKAIRKLPLGNFVSFTSEILRTGFATSSIAMKHIASNNPVLREQGYRMLTGQAITLWGMNEGIKQFSSMMTGVSETQLDAYKKYFAPDFMKYSNLVPVTKMKDGVFKVFDMSRFHPYDIITSSASQLMGVVEKRQLEPQIAQLKEQLREIDISTPEGEAQAKALRKQIRDLRIQLKMAKQLDPKKIPGDVFKAYFNTVGPLWNAVTGTFLGIPIGAEAFSEAITGKTREGSTIWSEGMRDTEKFDRSLNHFFKTIEPGIISSGRKIWHSLKGDVSGVGQPLEIETEAFKLMGGSNVTIDIPGSFDLSVRNLQKSFIEPKMGTGWYSTKDFRARGPDVLVSEYNKQNEQAFRHQYEFWKLSQAAMDAGFMSRAQISRVLMDRIGNKRVVSNILNGRFSAISYGEEGLKSRMNKIKRNDPYLSSEYGFSYFLPIGALERVKGNWEGKKFQEFEIKPEALDKQSAAPQLPETNTTATAEMQTTPIAESGTPIVSNQATLNNVNPQTGLTTTEDALLSPSEKAIRLNQRGMA